MIRAEVGNFIMYYLKSFLVTVQYCI